MQSEKLKRGNAGSPRVPRRAAARPRHSTRGLYALFGAEAMYAAGAWEPARGGQAGEPANAERPSFVICQGLEALVDDGCGNDILAEGNRHRRAGSKR